MEILSNVQNLVSNGISGGSVIAIIAITLLSAVVLIGVGSSCLFGMKKLFNKLFGKHEENNAYGNDA